MLAFLPSLIYFVMAPLSVSLALWLAFSAVFVVGIRDFAATRSLRLFDGSGLVLFGVLALYEAILQPGSTVADTSIVVEAGFMATALWSMSVNRPFTAQYQFVRKKHDPAIMSRAHTLLTAVWTTCFAAMTAAHAGTVLLHQLSPSWANGLAFAAFAATLTFTWQFGVYIDRHAGNSPRLWKL